ncbi:MAG TPA: hypothetical protein VGC87_00450 [Pyrinomonadaceae bacterium]
MITGFNTDVEHDGVVYHVQTEDKGLKSPLILSLVYVGGTILASKRTPYEDLVKAGYDEKVLSERLNRQHKLICAAIHAGRIEDLKRQTERDAGMRGARPAEQPQPSEAVPIQPEPEAAAEAVPPEPPPASVLPPPPTAPPPDLILVRNADDEPAPVVREKAPPPHVAATPVEEVTPQPQPPAPPATEHVDYSRVVDYYGSISPVDELQVSIVDEKKFVAGEFVKIHVFVGGGDDGTESVAGAAVTLKVLGSSFRPLIFNEKTGADGVATFYTMLPYFTSGRAAILVSATAESHRAELRRIIHQA